MLLYVIWSSCIWLDLHFAIAVFSLVTAFGDDILLNI